MLEEWQIAYAAGLFDGEGYVSLNKGYKGYIMNVGLEMSSITVVNRLVRWFGGTIYFRVPRKEGWKGLWTWRLTREEAVEFLERALPYLLVKDLEAQLGLFFADTFRGYGAGFSIPTETVRIRDFIIEVSKETKKETLLG